MLMGKYHILLQEEIAINSSLLMRELATLQLLETWIEKWYIAFLILPYKKCYCDVHFEEWNKFEGHLFVKLSLARFELNYT
jgi:hypothetical protein